MKKVYLAGLLVFALFLTGCDIFIGGTSDPIIRVRDRLGTYENSTSAYKVVIKNQYSQGYVDIYSNGKVIVTMTIDLYATGTDYEGTAPSTRYKYRMHFDNDSYKLILEVENPSGQVTDIITLRR